MRTEDGRQALDAILAHPGDTLLGLDFDGTLAPIVRDPEQAYADPGAIAALRRITGLVKVVIITGRPVKTVLRLGGFHDDPDFAGLTIAGQYGAEYWDAVTDTVEAEPTPEGIAPATEEVEQVLDDLDLDARVELKGRAVGVHTRELPDPEAAMQALEDPLQEIAERHDLKVEPGRNVLELRGPGQDKGEALRCCVERTQARSVIYVGDDLGDIPAFQAVHDLRATGVPGLLVCSASTEQDALRDLADMVVDGPDGVAKWLTDLADELAERG